MLPAETVTVVVNGAPYQGWKSVTVNQSFDNAAGTAILVVSETQFAKFPIKDGAQVQILLGTTPAITGYVQTVDGSDTWTSHEISLKIDDQTIDFIQSTLGPGHDYKPPIKLADLLRKTLGKMGLGKIGVIDKVNPEEFGPAEVPTGAVDQFGHEFGDQWARQRQTVLNTDGKGNLVIDRNRQEMGAGRLWRARETDPTNALNNIKGAKYKKDISSRYNKTMQASQKSQNDKKHWESRPKGDHPAQALPMSKKWGEAQDTGIRPERKRHYRGSKGLNNSSPKKGAKWRSNLSKSRGFQYSATVQGFERGPGALWWPGKLVTVRDDNWDLADVLFIVAVRFHKDWSKGATTEVSCTYSDAFTEQDDGTKSRTGKSGVGGSDPGDYAPADTSGTEYQDGG